MVAKKIEPPEAKVIYILNSSYFDVLLARNRPHMDTPRGHLQFAFACTDTVTTHICEQHLSFEDAVQNLESLGMVCTQEQKGKCLLYCDGLQIE